MYIAGAMALAAFLFTGSAFAASSKFAAEIGNKTLILDTEVNGGKTDILSASIHTPNQKDLLIGVSLETSLYTLTKVKGKNGETDTEGATAGLIVRVSVDTAGVDVVPDEVYFDHRFQRLSATLGGVISTCEDTGTYDPTKECGDTANIPGTPDGVITVECECVVTDEEIELLLDTMGAHHFNFVAADLPPGTHTITVEVEIVTDTTSGDATAKAGVGKGSLTIEEVRAVKDEISILN
jgi:hypothetical protein